MRTKGAISGTRRSPGVCHAPEDVSGRDHLVAEYLPLVHRLCRRFRHSGEPLEDIVQVGTVGLLKAIDKYDPDRGSEFAAFAVPVIVGEIKNYFRDHGWALKIPRKLQRQKLLVEKAVGRLSQSLGRSPTVLEIAENIGASETEVYDTFEVARPLSLDAEFDWNGDGDATNLLDGLGSEDPQFEEMIDRVDLTNSLSCLNARERGGYVNRCVNDIRRRPSQPLIQWRFHPHTVHRDRRLRSTQGPSDA